MGLFSWLFGRRKTERRQHKRVPAYGVKVRIDGEDYWVADLSLGGFRLHPYEGDLIERQFFPFEFIAEIEGEEVAFPNTGLVVRIDHRGLAARYTKPQQRFVNYLKRYIRVQQAGAKSRRRR